MAKKININNLPKLNILNTYNRFNLDFLTKKDNLIFNGEFDVTESSERLLGVPSGNEEIHLIDYLVYRPVPKEIMIWQDIPNIHPDSLDMENWYNQLINFAFEGVWVDGEYWNPFMIYWLNVFVFPVYKLDKQGNTSEDFEPGHPYYCNIDRYIFDILWKCEILRKDFAMMGGRGVGKNAWFSTPYATPKGFVPVGELNIGDEVFTANGDITRISGIQDYNEDSPIYNVVLKDGRETNCGTGHLWPVYEYNKEGLRTAEAIDIAENLFYGKKEKQGYRYHIPIASAIEYKDNKLLVEPYLLGFLLGDDTICDNGVRIFTEDIEVVEYFQSALGEEYTMVKDPTTVSWRITYKGKQRKIDKRGVLNLCNPFMDKLKDIGVWETRTKTKRIPSDYLYSSKEQRLELLKGLMDSGGYAHNRGYMAGYYSVNKELIDDVSLLVRSLGIKCRLREDRRLGIIKGYSLSIYTGREIFKLNRKQCKLKDDNNVPKRVKTNRYRTAIVSMELETVHKEKSRCIEVEHHSHLYLANDYIVTHNSFIAGNIMDREYRLIPNSLVLVSSTNEETTNEAWNKIEECLTVIERKHRALKHKRIIDSLSTKYSGEIIELPDGTTEDRGYLSRMEKIIYGKNGGKTRGKRPTKQLIEEFAAFPNSTQKGSLRACMRESRGSWFVGGSIKKCIVMYTGTGGTVENDEAEEIFLNPKAHNILPTYDWPDAGENGCGVFIPTHIKRSGTWEKTGCPDVTKATIETQAERLEAKNDPISYMGLLQEYPMSLKEVFMRRGSNIFDQNKIAEQRTRIEFDKDIPKPGKGFLKWKEGPNGKIIGVEWDSAPINGDIEILEHPHWLRADDGDPEDRTPMKNLYVGGCDSIDQGTGDSSWAKNSVTGSELGILIKKRILNTGYFKFTSNIYVAQYKKRSVDVRTDWDNALKLAYYYNAEINVEYTKIGIVGWFRDKGFYHLLKKRPSIALQSSDPNKMTNLIGTQASTPVIDHMDGKTKSYIDDYYSQIYFKKLLGQLQDYSRESRTKYDLVIAMGLTELADEDLLGKVAKVPVRETQELQLFGYYTDPETGYKKHGIIPDKSKAQDEMGGVLEAEKFRNHGSMRWIDMTDPGNPVPMYD